MKKYFLSILIIVPLMFSECRADNPGSPAAASESDNPVVSLSDEMFRKMIFNYSEAKEWKFAGNKPAIIDFYADWCAPCRQLSPLIEEIAKEYKGKIDVYKVDTEKEKILAQNIGVTALPTLLFIPVEGQPQVTMGALPKESLEQAISEILKITK
jgi:thioredoxin